MVERLEVRVLFDVQVNAATFDTTDVHNQVEAATLAFTPQAAKTSNVVAAWNDPALSQFGMVGQQAQHFTGTAISQDSGATFTQNLPSPTLPWGSASGLNQLGDGGDSSFAWDAANGTLYLATLSAVPAPGAGGAPDTAANVQIFASLDGGKTYTSVSNATPLTGNRLGVDKPWITVDNFAQSPNYGTVYLTYVNEDDKNVYLSAWQPMSSSAWSSSFVKEIGSGYGPQVIVGADYSVNVLYDAQGTSGDPFDLVIRQWKNNSLTAPIALAGIQNVGSSPSFYFDVPDPGGQGVDTSIARATDFPSVAVNPDTQRPFLYYAFTDASVGNDHTKPAEVMFGAVDLRNVSSAGASPMATGVGPNADPSLNDQWQPALAVSPDGNSLFLGFYGGERDWDSQSNWPVEHYNAYGITAKINQSGGFDTVGAAQQLTNVGTSATFASPYADSPVAGELADTDYNFLGDYTTATADDNNFYFGFTASSNGSLMETDPRPDLNHGARLGIVTAPQSDIHVATVPIPAPAAGTYVPPTPTVASTAYVADGNPHFVVNWDAQPYQQNDCAVYFEYSTPTQGWTAIQLSGSTDAYYGYQFVYIPNYDSKQTYWLRLRTSYSLTDVLSATGDYSNERGDSVAPSPYSQPVVLKAQGDLVIQGHHVSVKLDPTLSGDIDATVDGRPYPPMPFSANNKLDIKGTGAADDTITVDQSAGNLLVGATTIYDTGGSEAVTLIGTSGSDAVTLDDASATTNGHILTLNNVGSLAYVDDGGNDSVATTSTSVVPKSISTGTGTDSITLKSSGAATINTASTSGGSQALTIATGATPTLTINAASGSVTLAANAGTGIRAVNVASLTISNGARVTLGANGLANHANRSVLVIASKADNSAAALTMDTTATLDLTDNDMVLRGSTADEAKANETMVAILEHAAYDNAKWDKAGITSSSAGASLAGGVDITALGYGQAKYFPQYSVAGKAFDGIAYSATDVYVKYTYAGDTNLDGKVDGSDYNAIDSNIPIASPNGVWALGDLNYDRAVNSTDYNIADTNQGAGAGLYGDTAPQL